MLTTLDILLISNVVFIRKYIKCVIGVLRETPFIPLYDIRAANSPWSSARLAMPLQIVLYP